VLIKFRLRGIAENERVAEFILIGHANDPREDRPLPRLGDIVMRL
jgi:hypothetical protein